jgi:hypothetical protein
MRVSPIVVFRLPPQGERAVPVLGVGRAAERSACRGCAVSATGSSSRKIWGTSAAAGEVWKVPSLCGEVGAVVLGGCCCVMSAAAAAGLLSTGGVFGTYTSKCPPDCFFLGGRMCSTSPPQANRSACRSFLVFNASGHALVPVTVGWTYPERRCRRAAQFQVRMASG